METLIVKASPAQVAPIEAHLGSLSEFTWFPESLVLV